MTPAERIVARKKERAERRRREREFDGPLADTTALRLAGAISRLERSHGPIAFGVGSPDAHETATRAQWLEFADGNRFLITSSGRVLRRVKPGKKRKAPDSCTDSPRSSAASSLLLSPSQSPTPRDMELMVTGAPEKVIEP